MTFEFGQFRLDESARALRLAKREIALQPRIFDLLVYLVRHRERVVPKDELLEALWPGVTVTDNSLQRAVSLLRSALREGGMDKAVRSFPRSGYRFHLDPDAERDDPGEGAQASVLPVLDAARRALGEQRWGDAADHYEQADAGSPLNGGDFDGWARALQCQGRPSDAVPVLVRATAAHTQAGDPEAAAMSATTLSTIHLEHGDAALAQGWIARAHDLLGAAPDSVVAGQVLWMRSRLAAVEGDPQQALALADAAYALGRSKGDVATEALGLVYRGFFRLSLGDTHAGLADQDHAAALALSSRIDPITGGVLYCNILWACRTFGDWARANQWTLGYQDFCSSNRMAFSGSCQLHRAEVLGVRGSLHDALAHIEDALSRLGSDAPWALGDAHRVLGDIQSAMGNDEAALAAYEKSDMLGWDPEPGRAMLLVQRGDPAAAYAGLERSLVGHGWWALQRQGVLLAHLALVAAHAGRREKAEALIADLTGQPERWPMASIRALVNEASALLARQRGDTGEALRHLQLARQLWTSIESRLHAARLRLEIASLQVEIGNRSGAETELRVARTVSEELAAGKLLRQCQALEERLL